MEFNGNRGSVVLQPVCSQQNDTAELLGGETLSHLQGVNSHCYQQTEINIPYREKSGRLNHLIWWLVCVCVFEFELVCECVFLMWLTLLQMQKRKANGESVLM